MNARAMIAGQRVRLVLLRRRLGNELARDRARALGFLGIGVGVAVAVFALSFGGAWWAVQQRAPQLVFTGTIVGLTGLAVAYKDMETGLNATAAITDSGLILVDASGIDITLDCTAYTSGSLTFTARPMIG